MEKNLGTTDINQVRDTYAWSKVMGLGLERADNGDITEEK